MLFVGRLLLPLLFAQAARTKSPELFLAACLLVVIVASLVTRRIGFSPMLGALIAGIVIAETEYRGEVEVITAPFRGLGLGIFLITVGMSVDLPTARRQLAEVTRSLSLRCWRSRRITALPAAAERRTASVAAETGRPDGVAVGNHADRACARRLRGKLIAPEAAAFWQIVTAMGLTVTPLARQAWPLRREPGPARVVGRSTPRSTLPEPGQVVILGFGRVGRIVADMLDAHDKDYLAVDSRHRCGRARPAKEGYDVLFGDVAPGELIERLRERSPSAFMLTMDDPVLVRRLTRSCGTAFPTSRSSPGPATPRMPPSCTRRERPTRCPRRSKRRSSWRKRCWSTSASQWAR